MRMAAREAGAGRGRALSWSSRVRVGCLGWTYSSDLQQQSSTPLHQVARNASGTSGATTAPPSNVAAAPPLVGPTTSQRQPSVGAPTVALPSPAAPPSARGSSAQGPTARGGGGAGRRRGGGGSSSSSSDGEGARFTASALAAVRSRHASTAAPARPLATAVGLDTQDQGPTAFAADGAAGQAQLRKPSLSHAPSVRSVDAPPSPAGSWHQHSPHDGGEALPLRPRPGSLGAPRPSALALQQRARAQSDLVARRAYGGGDRQRAPPQAGSNAVLAVGTGRPVDPKHGRADPIAAQINRSLSLLLPSGPPPARGSASVGSSAAAAEPHARPRHRLGSAPASLAQQPPDSPVSSSARSASRLGHASSAPQRQLPLPPAARSPDSSPSASSPESSSPVGARHAGRRSAGELPETVPGCHPPAAEHPYVDSAAAGGEQLDGPEDQQTGTAFEWEEEEEAGEGQGLYNGWQGMPLPPGRPNGSTRPSTSSSRWPARPVVGGSRMSVGRGPAWAREDPAAGPVDRGAQTQPRLRGPAPAQHAMPAVVHGLPATDAPPPALGSALPLRLGSPGSTSAAASSSAMADNADEVGLGSRPSCCYPAYMSPNPAPLSRRWVTTCPTRPDAPTTTPCCS